ncbi:MAG: caspase family protein [Nitrososphaeraceae archaeon]|nr:caspase family protein [Nitrososphaeraceae archaeon]
MSQKKNVEIPGLTVTKKGHPNKEKKHAKFISVVQQAVASLKPSKKNAQPAPTVVKPPKPTVTSGAVSSNIVKKCLLIGINYNGSGSQLNGCINDSENLKLMLINSGYFKENEITMLNDNLNDNLFPTKANLLAQFNEIVKFANENKDKQVRLFVSYSGHGTSVVDKNGDEDDGMDEALCPVDYVNSGFIVDDDIRSNFINLLPENAKLVMLVDACHSATMLDLKYSYLVNAKNTYLVHDKNAATLCDVVSISGCRDNQTSADAWEFDIQEKKNEAQGAMTASFLASYSENISYHALIDKIRVWLKVKGYAQVPQLTSGKLVDIENRFMLETFK